jgi:hypothetical protein
MLQKLSFIVVTLLLAQLSFAQTKVEATATQTTDTTKKEDEADQLITNRRLRADSGSLSKWSVSTFFNYQGASLEKPTGAERPNIVNGADALTLTNLSGSVGVKYRLTKLDSLTFSTGFNITTPFHDSFTAPNSRLQEAFNKNKQKLTVNDPALKYTHLNKIWGVQSVTNLTMTVITNAQLSDLGYRNSYLISQTFMKDVANTGFSYGAGLQVLMYDFDKENRTLTQAVPGIYPAAEYVINDTYNIRTVFGWQVYENLRNQDTWTFSKRKVYQSVGLGISLSRDVFLYPNIQFIPSDLRNDKTNIAISANINVF